MNKFLFKHIDNTGLVLWRIIFGMLITVQAFGEIVLGGAKRNFIDPDFTFNFIGFDFLQPLPGNGMYFYFALMGIFGIMVTLGYKYRFSMFCYALMWTCVYLMQKTSYNNHYYLMMLLCWIMVFLPANRSLSLDAKWTPNFQSNSVPRWTYLVIIFQVWIVYTFASIAKIYPDWLNGTVTALFMKGKSDYWLIGGVLQLDWVHHSMAYVGILFDLLIIPMLLWKRTRVAGFIISIFFHLFNSVVFQIGIFPYMSMAFALFFFSSETLRRRFLPFARKHFQQTKIYTQGEVIVPNYKPLLLTVCSLYFLIQIALPLRHWAFKDDVLWTEEGHRLAWRMMLRSRSGLLIIYTENKETGERNSYNYRKLLSKKQNRNVKTKPDLIWQLAQRIQQKEAEKGNDVAVYVTSRVKVNGGEYYPFIDPNVDLANEKWHHFKHHNWILPSPEDYMNKPEKE
jgi:hypothetical protein